MAPGPGDGVKRPSPSTLRTVPSTSCATRILGSSLSGRCKWPTCHLVRLKRRNCRKTSGTLGATGGDSLGKPLCRACHLARTESGWCLNSCSLDIRAQLLPLMRVSCPGNDRGGFGGRHAEGQDGEEGEFWILLLFKHQLKTTNILLPAHGGCTRATLNSILGQASTSIIY